MRRRTLSQVRTTTESGFHHYVYVVLLDNKAGSYRRVLLMNPRRNPKLPCVYVGMTGLKPEERFLNHKTGVKSAWIVKRHGIRLLPELYEWLNPMPFAAAAQMEEDLAEDLRNQGYTVMGGH